MSHPEPRTIGLLLDPGYGAPDQLAVVQLSVAEVNHIVRGSASPETPLPDGVVMFRPRGSPEEEPRCRGHAGLLEIAPPASLLADNVRVYDVHQRIAHGTVRWGGVLEGGGVVTTCRLSITALRRAVEPYPVTHAAARRWRAVARTCPACAAVLLRASAEDPLALSATDLMPLQLSTDAAVREAAIRAFGRVRRSGQTSS